jgi:hypothetical protein
VTIEEIKQAAAQMSAEDRRAFADWINGAEDVRALHRTVLIEQVQGGVERTNRGGQEESEFEG